MTDNRFLPRLSKEQILNGTNASICHYHFARYIHLRDADLFCSPIKSSLINVQVIHISPPSTEVLLGTVVIPLKDLLETARTLCIHCRSQKWQFDHLLNRYAKHRESINFVASVSIFIGSKARLLSRLVSRRMIRSLSSLFANGLLGIMKTTRVLFLRQLSAWGQLWQRSKAAREVLAVPPHLSIYECCLQTILITLLVDPHLRRSSGSMACRMTLRTGSWLGCKGTNLW